MTPGPTARGELAGAVGALARAGVSTPGPDAEWLLAGALGVRRARALTLLDGPLAPPVASRFREMVRRRAAREPLQQVLGWEEFRGLRFSVTPAVLVPRPETERLVELALERLPPPGPRPRRVADVGTGSGCIAGAVAHARPDARVLATDASPAAAALARANLEALGLTGRVLVVRADLLGPVAGGGLDLIVANPPYLPTAELAGLAPEVRVHEPRAALDGGPDGLAVIRRLVPEARRALGPGGWLVLETAGGPQAGQVAALLAGAGFGPVQVRPDLPGVERFVAGRAPGG